QADRAFLSGLLAAHDHERFTIIGYSMEPNLPVPGVDWYYYIAEASDEQLCAQIRTDKCDVLVDIPGHFGGNRMTALTRKPAPIQVGYLGYPNTSGIKAIDYRFTDAWADPPG